MFHRYHWRYHSTLATTLLHDLHLWHRGHQDSTTIHAFTHTCTYTHHVHTPKSTNLISFLAAFFFPFFSFFLFLSNAERGMLLTITKLRLPRMPVSPTGKYVDLFPPWRFSSFPLFHFSRPKFFYSSAIPSILPRFDISFRWKAAFQHSSSR